MAKKTTESQSPVGADYQEHKPDGPSDLGNPAGDEESHSPTHRGYQSGISELEQGVADHENFMGWSGLDPDCLYATILSAQAGYDKLLQLERHRTSAVTERLRAASAEHSDELI
ncbi:unnamed protein product [Penicillium egyptiacum]|uniref:Uncharacterized protein n=1 Tax=Penicillium egyptiacum TaxID=1303716 RepID=A0A9W4K3G8_9EURO|nr:unnamed protein product [Penicillium egyptiacum]